jgi:hypothetical protein
MLNKEIPLYMPASMQLNPEEGFKCGNCIMGTKDTSECTVLDPAEIDLEYGICGLYVPGGNTTSKEHKPMEIVPKKVAGYTEKGPTYCGICEYFIPRSGECKVVKGKIDKYGCCNHWSSGE